jgi:DNA polymerase
MKGVMKDGRGKVKVGLISFEAQSGMLFAHLPSGRRLSYVKPQIGENRFGGESITYMGIDSTKHWSRIETFGGKLVENCVQGVSRDVLANAMKNLRDCRIVGHVHDELIIEAAPDAPLQDICDQMGRTPEWLPGICLRADGYECSFYQKQ